MQSITDATFDEEIGSSAEPVLVDFWAEWCGPCKTIAPILEEIAEEKAGSLKVVKMDADANPVTPAQYRVTGLPTINLYVNGEVVRSITGVRPKSAILAELEEFVS